MLPAKLASLYLGQWATMYMYCTQSMPMYSSYILWQDGHSYHYFNYLHCYCMH